MSNSSEYAAAQIADTGSPMQSLHLIDEISHRVVNEYTDAICALGLAATASRDMRVQLALTSAAIRLRAHAEAHRALQAPTIDGPMDLVDYVGQVCTCLTKASLVERGVWFTVIADEIWLDADRCWRVGLIVAELVRNAARHGFSEGAGVIWIEITEESGRIHCLVCDDGCGGPTTRTGRRLVEALAVDLGGTVDWNFAPGGCCVRLDFPRTGATELRPPAPERVSHFPHPAATRRFR